MKISTKGFIFHKDAEKFTDCFDRYGYNLSTNKFAISDGVSKSFFPDVWAELLVENFVNRNGRIDLTDSMSYKLIQNKWIKKVSEIVTKPQQKYFVKNLFIQGRSAAATFVGLHFFSEENVFKWEAVALGDSFLFFIPELIENINDNFSEITYLSSKSDLHFNNFPDYFDSRSITNKGKIKQKKQELRNGTFYLMTDALAEWFINEKDAAREIITSWATQEDFENTIKKYQNIKIANDDTSIIVLKISEDHIKEINYEKVKITEFNLLLEKENKFFEENSPTMEQLVPIEKLDTISQDTSNEIMISLEDNHNKKKKGKKRNRKKRK